MATTKRYCIDCGTRLVYYAILSNPKASNDCRVLTYSCPKCTKTFEKPVLISVQRNTTDDPLKIAKVFITSIRKEKK